MLGGMSPEVLPDASASIDDTDAVATLSYAVTATEHGDMETGDVLLDGRPVGRLSQRRRPGPDTRRAAEGSPEAITSVWHAEAVGWLPHAGRPWDRRVTSTAPTRRRAAEDLLRAYRNRG